MDLGVLNILTLKTVPKAPEPSTLIFLNSVSFRILSSAWLGASPLGVNGSTSYSTRISNTLLNPPRTLHVYRI